MGLPKSKGNEDDEISDIRFCENCCCFCRDIQGGLGILEAELLWNLWDCLAKQREGRRTESPMGKIDR